MQLVKLQIFMATRTLVQSTKSLDFSLESLGKMVQSLPLVFIVALLSGMGSMSTKLLLDICMSWAYFIHTQKYYKLPAITHMHFRSREEQLKCIDLECSIQMERAPTHCIHRAPNFLRLDKICILSVTLFL